MRKALILFFALCLLSVNSFGQTSSFVKEYTFRLDDGEDQKIAINSAQEQLRKMLLADILEDIRKSNAPADISSSGDDGGETAMTDKEVNQYRKAIVVHTHDKMKILEEKTEGSQYFVKAQINANISEIKAYVEKKNAPAQTAQVEKKENYTNIQKNVSPLNANAQVAANNDVLSAAQMLELYEFYESYKAGNLVFCACNDKQFVASARSQFLYGSAAYGAGATIEIGVIGRRFFTVEGGYGANYFGGGLNVGGIINRDGLVKNVITFSPSYYNNVIKVKVHNLRTNQNEEDNGMMGSFLGDAAKNHEHMNLGTLGITHKLLVGKTHNVDITSKFLFGIRQVCVNETSYSGSSNGSVQYDDYDFIAFNFTYSLSFGYTLTLKTKGKQNGKND